MNKKKSAPLATLTLILGILSLLAFFIPIAFFPLAVCTLLLSAFVLITKRNGKERAKSAIILVITGGVLLAAWFAICFLFMDINIFAI